MYIPEVVVGFIGGVVVGMTVLIVVSVMFNKRGKR